MEIDPTETLFSELKKNDRKTLSGAEWSKLIREGIEEWLNVVLPEFKGKARETNFRIDLRAREMVIGPPLLPSDIINMKQLVISISNSVIYGKTLTVQAWGPRDKQTKLPTTSSSGKLGLDTAVRLMDYVVKSSCLTSLYVSVGNVQTDYSSVELLSVKGTTDTMSKVKKALEVDVSKQKGTAKSCERALDKVGEAVGLLTRVEREGILGISCPAGAAFLLQV